MNCKISDLYTVVCIGLADPCLSLFSGDVYIFKGVSNTHHSTSLLKEGVVKEPL